MEFVTDAFQFFLHIDKHLNEAAMSYGNWIYAILFLIVFCETGLVVTPFLPGDSLLFAAGALGALGSMNVVYIIVLLIIAAILGDTVNYWIGHWGGHHFATRFIKKQHLDRTHEFYEKYGGKTIVIARFVPIVRTIAPFVAGLGDMTYARFMSYNVFGGILWVLVCTLAGYFFGNLDFVKRNFSLVILMIIFISVLPMVYEIWRARSEAKKKAAAAAAGQVI